MKTQNAVTLLRDADSLLIQVKALLREVLNAQEARGLVGDAQAEIAKLIREEGKK